jgi:hypothetical protein
MFILYTYFFCTWVAPLRIFNELAITYKKK